MVLTIAYTPTIFSVGMAILLTWPALGSPTALSYQISAACYSWTSIRSSQSPQISRALGLAHAFWPHVEQVYLILFLGFFSVSSPVPSGASPFSRVVRLACQRNTKPLVIIAWVWMAKAPAGSM